MSQDAEVAPTLPDSDPAVETAPAENAAARLVPVAESIKYRRRAQQAESQLQQLQQQLTETRSQLEQRLDEVATAEAQRDEANHRLCETQNRLLAERVMTQAGVVDPDAAWLLLTRSLDVAEDLTPQTITDGVQRLLLDKPFLRAPQAPLPPKTASPRASHTIGRELTSAADRAVRTGDRRDIAQYLRLRRQSQLARSER